MKKYTFFIHYIVSLVLLGAGYSGYSQSNSIEARHKVTLPESHVGNLEIDTRLLDSYIRIPDKTRDFYLGSRAIFSGSVNADFTHPEIIKLAQKNNLPLMGGPMLGNLSANGVVIWLRPASSDPLKVKVTPANGGAEKVFIQKKIEPGVEQKVVVDKLQAATRYKYEVYCKGEKVAKGQFTTAPENDKDGIFRVSFGSCFHKIGLHNPNLINQILKRDPQAMMLLGDIAVDDRENRIDMHRSDYLLRDVSIPWQNLSANVPLYATWDDHDYLNNDLSGVPKRFNEENRKELRKVWQQNWNNPENKRAGIYFNTQVGPVEIIMLDTRSCRTNSKRGEYGSYLGLEQLNWLKETLKKSEAPFKILSSGTMWSDFVSNGKDSWGTWDTEAREEIFKLIEEENIAGVFLVSGDRHGARGFTIPRPSGFAIHEFEAASLGGVPGPEAMAKDTTHQLFGYHGTDAVAFGEFTFDTTGDQPKVVYRLINQFGKILEEHPIPYTRLSPK